MENIIKKELKRLPALAYITRTGGRFFVRFHKTENKKTRPFIQEWFDDLPAAKKFRDKKYIELLSSGSIELCRLNRPTREALSHNKTGVAGVFFTDFKQEKRSENGKFYIHHIKECCASWIEYKKENGVVKRKQGRKCWSLKKWGDQAFVMACELRREVEKRLNNPEHLKLIKEYSKKV